MRNSNVIKNSNLKSENLKLEINNFKNKFLSKSEYFVCKQDIVGIIISKYLEIFKHFFISNLKKLNNNFFIKFYKLTNKRSKYSSKLLKKFESLEQKIDSQQLIIERSFNLNSRLQNEVDQINDKIIITVNRDNIKYLDYNMQINMVPTFIYYNKGINKKESKEIVKNIEEEVVNLATLRCKIN